jgi:hypothetical protein
MNTKITTLQSSRTPVLSVLLSLICIFFLNLSFVKSQTVFWVESFNNNCDSLCSDSTYVGTNGAWKIILTGTNGSAANTWFVSCAENGNNVGACGSTCTTNDATLHIGNVSSSPLASIFCPTGDCGAAYDAGDGDGTVISNQRATSPTINCTGKSTITIKFKYEAHGQPGHDYCTVDYFDGTTWMILDTITPSNNVGCSGQGKWTAHAAITLPSSANNNANVKIGFNWTNNDDGAGNDPSIAIDSVALGYQTTTGLAGMNSLANSIQIFPNPSSSGVNISFIQQEKSSFKINIINTKGQVVYSEANTLFMGTYNKNINLKDQPKGIYFLQIITDNEVLDTKIILQ